MSDESSRGIDFKKVPPLLWRALWSAEGRYEGLLFALKCEADIAQIRAELQDREEMIARRLAHDPHGSASPGASPRIYADGYLAGLREAMDIITAWANGNGQ